MEEKETKKKTETPAMSMEDMQAQFAAMLEEVKAEARKEAAAIIDDAKAAAAQIVGEAKQSMNTGDTAADAEAKVAQKAYLNELVKIKLFKDTGKYKDDVFVSCNGEAYAIKRGIEVEVPRKIALILEASYSQDIETSEMMEAKSAEFAKSGL